MNPTEKKDVFNAIKECSNSMDRMTGEREYIKETIIALNEKYDLEKKTLSKVIKIYNKQNLAEVRTAQTDLEDLYEEITHTA
jgi:regulator of replication initiation timing